jgi:hypothetical protein
VVGRVPFGLDVYHVQAKEVLADEPVKPLVTRPAKVLGHRFQAAVAHADEQLQDEPFKELRWRSRMRASRSPATVEWASSITSVIASAGDRCWVGSSGVG